MRTAMISPKSTAYRAGDLFFGGTSKDVIMQLDTSNCMDGGADPIAVLKQYSKRAASIHIKEWGGPADAVIGQGKVDFQAVFDICEKNGVTKWYVVEHEREGQRLGQRQALLRSHAKIRKSVIQRSGNACQSRTLLLY